MRRELKYTVPGSDMRLSLTRLRSLVPSLRLEHAPRQVTNVYFDSAHYACYHASTSGLARRLKVRVRWYDDIDVARNPVLELKHRVGQRGWKTRFPIEGLDLEHMTWNELRSRIWAQLPAAQAIRLAPLRFPVLLVTYRRHYFCSPDRRVRVTVDRHLRYFDQRNRPYPNFVFDTVSAECGVVECKLEEGSDVAAARILHPLGLRWTRFSKYCHGVEALSRRPG